MASAKTDFEEFVRWVHKPENEIASNVRRLVNLVQGNFDAVLATSRQHNQRSALLASLAQPQLLQTPDELPIIDPIEPGRVWMWRRLHGLTVGPFRGFRHPEPFDLRSRIVLFYGPNGSGKTSLCEALEYALLGSVEEAEAKRIAAATYLSNVHERRFDQPTLSATDHQGNEINVEANPDAYRFCFIEKNRIDAFSRIAARPAAQRTEIISTLFGMDKFNEFVNHFNESMDSQLTLRNDRRLLLAARRTALARDETEVSTEADSLLALDIEESLLAHGYSEDMTYEVLKDLFGKVDTPGRLQKLNEILNSVPPQILNITRNGLEACYEKADVAYQLTLTLAESLAQQASQISFKGLYTAVLNLQGSEGDHCPACDTPLNGPNHTLHNPYEKAVAGLTQLKELAELQARHTQSLDDLVSASRALQVELEAVHRFIVSKDEQDTLVGRYLALNPGTGLGDWWSSIYAVDGTTGHELPSLENILDVAHRIEEQDIASALAKLERQRDITERDRLIEYQLLAMAQDNKRQLLIENIVAARQRIKDFSVTNAELIEQAAQEVLDNERDAPIKEAYDSFYVLLRRYRNELPGTLIAGLNNRAMELYNEFNRNDLDPDKLEELHLPLNGDERIEIAFRGNPEVRVDALKILSEGHIRCLGLAILLAKNLSLDCPLIVFDDAINAIDHEHRRGIREAVFENDNFTNSQIILTCHSHEFIKDIHQSLSAAARNDSKVYLLRNHNGNYHPRVNGNIASRNYVEMARAAREELNDRGALDASRKALEMLMEKTWRWLGSHEHGLLNVLLAGSGSEPTLRNLCEALRKKIVGLETFNHTNKPLILEALERVLGIPEQNLVWMYLNKGVHEEADRDDYDSDEVESVVVTLEQLEALDLRPGR